MNIRRFKIYRRSFICLLLASALVLTSPIVWKGERKAYATSAKAKKKAAEEKLDSVNEKIDSLEDSENETNSKIETTKSELNTLLSDMEELQGEITSKQEEIDRCDEDLAEAQENEEKQYASMKVRIQYMYENSTADNLWTAILESDGLADMLNRMEYVTQVYQSDRQLMDDYQTAVEEVEALQAKLTDDMDELLTMQEQYDAKQVALEDKLDTLKDQKDTYASQIAQAKQLANQYKSTITQLAETIQKEEEAAAAAAAARAAAAAAASASSSSSSASSSSSSGSSSTDSGLTDSDANPSATTNVSGAAVVSYAMQFVGNRYVWGGNSLTNGTDCSGFVHLVYAHFGISTPRYSQAFLNYGQPVSVSNAQAGDVIIYPGHVAIYIGNGCIVEAQSSSAGITCNRAAFSRTINGIRRYI